MKRTFINYSNLVIIVLIIFFGLFNKVNAQTDKNYNITEYEDSINFYFSLIIEEKNDIKKIEYNERIVEYFNKALKKSESFLYPFSSLKNVGVLKSEDNKLRIITWNLPFSDRTHKYFGYIQYKKSKKNYSFYPLNDNSEKIKNPETALLNNKNWFGALYYKIIVNKNKGKTYYTLLGADLNNLLTKKKVIDVLYMSKDELPIFGSKVFKNTMTPITRVIFEFNAQTNMTLTYDQDREMIVYDHLSPSRASLTGQYEFYGPDFSYDGLKYERGIWNSYTDIEVRDLNIKENLIDF